MVKLKDPDWAAGNSAPRTARAKRSKLAGLWAALKCRLLHRSDVSYWSNPSAFDTEWDARSRVAASLIPHGAQVLEFGAGFRRLEEFLDEGISYTPSDIVDRGPGTLVLDLNARPLPPMTDVDTAVFCGVLEYLRDVPAVIRWVADWASLCVVSYNCVHSSPGTVHSIAEMVKRARCGWVNMFTERELCLQFTAVGFALAERRVWNEGDDFEPIFVFTRA